jgi:hypothetical protein
VWRLDVGPVFLEGGEDALLLGSQLRPPLRQGFAKAQNGQGRADDRRAYRA